MLSAAFKRVRPPTDMRRDSSCPSPNGFAVGESAAWRRTASRPARYLRPATTTLLAAPLSACHLALMEPKGQVAADEKTLIITATLLMLIVVVPVIAMTLYFAWKYRATNIAATYTPNWAYSHRIEAVVWAVPCAIVLVLGIVTWRSTHELDPYKPLVSSARPITIDVVALDWKWLFIYPEQRIATMQRDFVRVCRDRPVRDRPQPIRRGIAAGQHRDNARRRTCVAHVDVDDRGMRVRRPDEVRIGLPRHVEIVAVLALAAQQPGILAPGHRFSDPFRGKLFTRIQERHEVATVNLGRDPAVSQRICASLNLDAAGDQALRRR